MWLVSQYRHTHTNTYWLSRSRQSCQSWNKYVLQACRGPCDITIKFPLTVIRFPRHAHLSQPANLTWSPLWGHWIPQEFDSWLGNTRPCQQCSRIRRYYRRRPVSFAAWQKKHRSRSLSGVCPSSLRSRELASSRELLRGFRTTWSSCALQRRLKSVIR